MQKCLIFVIVLTLILNLAGHAICVRFLKPIEDECASETGKIVSEAMFTYFEDVTLLSIVDIFDNMLLDMFKCTGGNNFKPVFSRRSYAQPSFYNLDYGPLNTHPSNRGSTLKGNYSHTIDVLYLRVLRNNPRTRALYVVDELELPSIKALLMHGYNEHKFVQNAIMSRRTSFNKTSGKNETQVVFCTFNPFIADGILFCKTLIYGSVYQSMKEIRKFMINVLRNFHGYPLKVFMFDYPMQSKPVYDKNGTVSNYEYMDGEIVKIFLKRLNFTPIYLTDNETFGVQLSNETFTGALNATETERADLAGNTRVIMNINTNRSLFLKSVTFGRYFFVIPVRVTHKEVLLSLVMTFDWYINAMFLICFVIFPFILFSLSKVETRIHKLTKPASLSDSTLKIAGLTCGISMRLSKQISSQIFLAFVLIYSIVQMTLFQSTIIRNLNTNVVVGEIKKLDQLLDKNYRFVLPDMLHTMFKKSDGSRIARKMRDISNNYTAYQKSMEKTPILNVATLMREIGLRSYIDQHYDNVTKKNIYTPVPEVAFQFYLSMMLPKNSPFQEKFNNLIQSIDEAGIVQYQLSLAAIDNMKLMIKRIRHGEVPAKDDRSINMRDFRSIFYLYAALNGFAVFIFVFEIFLGFVERKRQRRARRRVRFSEPEQSFIRRF